MIPEAMQYTGDNLKEVIEFLEKDEGSFFVCQSHGMVMYNSFTNCSMTESETLRIESRLDDIFYPGYWLVKNADPSRLGGYKVISNSIASAVIAHYNQLLNQSKEDLLNANSTTL